MYDFVREKYTKSVEVLIIRSYIVFQHKGLNMKEDFVQIVSKYCKETLDLHIKRHPLSKDLSDSQFMHAIRCVLGPLLQAFFEKPENKQVSGSLRLTLSKSLLLLRATFFDNIGIEKTDNDIYVEQFALPNRNIIVHWELIKEQTLV